MPEERNEIAQVCRKLAGRTCVLIWLGQPGRCEVRRLHRRTPSATNNDRPRRSPSGRASSDTAFVASALIIDLIQSGRSPRIARRPSAAISSPVADIVSGAAFVSLVKPWRTKCRAVTSTASSLSASDHGGITGSTRASSGVDELPGRCTRSISNDQPSGGPAVEGPIAALSSTAEFTTRRWSPCCQGRRGGLARGPARAPSGAVAPRAGRDRNRGLGDRLPMADRRPLI